MATTRFCRFGFTILLIGFLGLSWSALQKNASAQPAKKKVREEEEEDPKAKPKVPKKEEEEEPKEKTKVPAKVQDVAPKEKEDERPRPAVPTVKFDMVAEAAKKSHPVAVREFLRRIAIPYDVLISASDRRYKIALMKDRELPEGKVPYFELNANLLDGKQKELASSAGYSLLPYEEVVLNEVELFLKKKIDGFNHFDQLELVVQVLGSVRTQHASWAERQKRVGRGWDVVENKLKKRLVMLRRDQLKAYIDAKDWNRADELSLELSATFADDTDVQKDIYRLILIKADQSLNPTRDDDYLNLYQALLQFEQLPGGKGEECATAARRKLMNRAKDFINQAKELASANQSAAAFQKLRSAEALAPELDDISIMRSKLKDRILYIGVSQLPDLMSPATAKSDSERWAVELMFESLMQMVPDRKLGRHYRPVLATAQPSMVPLGREFQLYRNVRWSGDQGKSFVDARDVQGTLRLLKHVPDRWCSEGLEVFDPREVRIDDPFRLRLNFTQGVFEPLSRTTFKVLPARYLEAKDKKADDNEFGLNPFGSGPYRYSGREKETADREVAIFRSNPYFAQRTGMLSKPRIPEIRFFVPKQSSISNEIASGQVHMILDVPVGDIPMYTADTIGKNIFKEYKLDTNRRIHMLAVNHRRPILQSVELRRGLSAGIEREEILKDVFRIQNHEKEHTALTGPFPLKTWATPSKSQQVPLTNPALSAGLISLIAKDAPLRISLRHPDDPYSTRACQKIKEQIEKNAGQVAGRPTIEITLEGLSPALLRQRVEVEHDFELAYYTFDYRDDQFWLGGLLDPSATAAYGRNFLGYLGDGTGVKDEDSRLRQTLEDSRPTAISATSCEKRPGIFTINSTLECRSYPCGNSIVT